MTSVQYTPRRPVVPWRPDPRRVLVLDGSTNTALACVRSLGRAGYTVFVAGQSRWPLGAWSRFCRGRYRYAEATPDESVAMRVWAHEQSLDSGPPLTEPTCQLRNADRHAAK